MTVLDLAREWLRYAKSDLSTAKHMFENVSPGEIEISCYHTQQCAEKSLKAFLILRMIDPPRTHDLVELVKLCMAHDLKFSTLQQYCTFLNPYGVNARYPNELFIDDSITKIAIEYAKIIFDFCNNIINNTQTVP